MQSIGWYLRRARTMSPGELAWRIRSEIRDAVDACRVPLRLYPRIDVQLPPLPAAPRWCPAPLGEWRDLAAGDPAVEWRDRLIARADAIAAHRLSFFDLEDIHLGDPIDWNRDHASGRRTPTGFAAAIDYRDYAVAGDAKVVWEPNRHHQFVVLGRAYRATGDRKYAAALVAQLGSWIDQCPFGTGMNWRSPLELAIRVVNWIWALDLITDSGVLTEAVRARVRQSIALHVWEIARKYSRGTSANNHRVGEACGVLTATSYYPELPDAAKLRDEARRILVEEISAQTYPSGATREQALGYQLFVLQLFLFAGLADQRSGGGFPSEYWARVRRMFDFVDTLARGGPVPMYGDADDGYVLDLGNRASDVCALRDVAAHVFDPRGAEPSTVSSETAHWLFGSSSASRHRPNAVDQGVALESTAFDDAGLYLLQWGDSASNDRVSVVFDCGELGFAALAAHGHADALSIAVRAFGVDVLVDPGTYDYFTFPEWRRYFRSTRAHNTVVLNAADQSAQLGLFLWGRRATARCLEWRPEPGGGCVAGEHDGYAGPGGGATCRRRLELDRTSRTLTITDEIADTGASDVELMFHFGEQCRLARADHELLVDCGAGTVVLRLDERLTVTTAHGGGVGEGGWVSRGYHRRTAALTVCGRMRAGGTTTLRSVLTFGEARP